ncbi:unnamed protein product, partial [Discosporangium mesarthrocarpum]
MLVVGQQQQGVGEDRGASDTKPQIVSGLKAAEQLPGHGAGASAGSASDTGSEGGGGSDESMQMAVLCAPMEVQELVGTMKEAHSVLAKSYAALIPLAINEFYEATGRLRPLSEGGEGAKPGHQVVPQALLSFWREDLLMKSDALHQKLSDVEAEITAACSSIGTVEWGRRCHLFEEDWSTQEGEGSGTVGGKGKGKAKCDHRSRA